LVRTEHLRRRQTDAFLAEKAEFVAMWREIENLARELQLPDARLPMSKHSKSYPVGSTHALT